jgi:Xaa-Pro dipeptidase
VGRGGTTHIHYFGATPMSEPAQSVPAQWPAARALRQGDVLTCEISASYWDYTGQLLRTFTVAEDPAPLYRELHDVADAATRSSSAPALARRRRSWSRRPR